MSTDENTFWLIFLQLIIHDEIYLQFESALAFCSGLMNGINCVYMNFRYAE